MKKTSKVENKINNNITVRNRFIGPAPMDYMIFAEEKINIDNDDPVYVSASRHVDGEMIYFVSDVSLFSEEENGSPLECYKVLTHAKKSAYYDKFKKLNKAVTNEMSRIMKIIDDTSLCGGIRFGSKYHSGLERYVEAVIEIEPINKKVYVQVIFKNDKYYYSLTRNSIFMKLELGNMYETYFCNNNEIEYMFQSDNLDQLGKYYEFKSALLNIKNELNNHFEIDYLIV